jgi:membrane fusion protein, heavy metal efflux system
VPLRVSVDNALISGSGSNEYALRPSMFATVELALGERVAAVVVPRAAIHKVGGDTVVFVSTGRVDGKVAFERRAIVTGTSDGRVVEVASGLVAGEMIATDNAHLLASELKTPHGQGAD